MDTSKLTSAQRQLRQNVRNFLLVATLEELRGELAISKERGDTFRAQCVEELIDERTAEDGRRDRPNL